jgi:hypothetical protein
MSENQQSYSTPTKGMLGIIQCLEGWYVTLETSDGRTVKGIKCQYNNSNNIVLF